MSKLPFIPTSEIQHQSVNQGEYKTPLDLNQALIPRPASTFLLVSDTQRQQIGKGDILVVDRSLTPGPGQLVIAVEEGELQLRHGPVAELWGVVTYVIRKTW